MVEVDRLVLFLLARGQEGAGVVHGGQLLLVGQGLELVEGHDRTR
jgi:hypothetical protein